MHIPKTAGSSLRYALERVYPEAERLYLYDDPELLGSIHPRDFPSLPHARRAGLRYVAGHFAFGLHRHLPSGARYVTVVRDPVDRVASHYHHYLTVSRRPTPERSLILEEGLTLEQWVFERDRIAADNLMVRHISGRASVPYGKCPDDMLTEALEHVDESFEWVLALERMSDSTASLASVLHARSLDVKRLNANERRTPLDEVEPKLVRRIRGLNDLDYRFHRKMLERFR